MACEVAEFLEQLPIAVDVVLVRSERWTEEHKAVMDARTDGVRMFLRRRRHLPVDAEAAQSSTNGAREAGASAKLGLEADEHGAATVVTENDRFCAMKIGPATQVGHLVFAQHGERAAEGLGSLHVRFFHGDMMSKWHDVWRLPSDSMSNAHAAD